MSLPNLLFEVCDFYICICRHQLMGLQIVSKFFLFRLGLVPVITNYLESQVLLLLSLLDLFVFKLDGRSKDST